MKNLDGDDRREERSAIKPFRYGLRRSCEPCRRKKKRCDGGQPCTRCAPTGGECQYNKNRWHYPQKLLHRQQRQLTDGERDIVRAGEDLAPSTTGALPGHRMLPLKRCRLRASPATGLVGMQENAFLSYFFNCVGFLSLTDESQVRETMVRIMTPAAPRPEPAHGIDFSGEGEHFSALEIGGSFGDVLDTTQLRKDPALCTFWCAIAAGALAKGSPIESVERYSKLAEEAFVASRSGSSYADLAKASVSLAYLHSFMGNPAKFEEALELSQSFLRASMNCESADLRVGIPDLIQRCSLVGNEAMPSPGAHEEDPPQLGEVLTERDLYQFVAESFRVFHQAAYTRAHKRCDGDPDPHCPGGPANETCRPDDIPSREVSEAMAEVLGTGNCPDFEPLEGTIDRPSIRAGIGGLLINGTLVFAKATKGDLYGTLERLGRSVEVYERYPGLCRCMCGFHMAHMLLTTLAAIDNPTARGLYDRLRGAYNACLVSHAAAIPALDEWRGMEAICGHVNCRALGNLVTSEHMKAFTPRPINSNHYSAGLTRVTRNPHVLPEDEALRTTIVHEEGVGLVSGSPRSSWAESNAMGDSKQSLDPAGAFCRSAASPAAVASLFFSRSQPKEVHDWDCVSRASSRDPASVPRPVEVRRRHEDIARTEDDEVAPAEWLKACFAMLDADHTL
ncbi:unnamed protein product [Scytosiphon promiscuus]